MKVSFNESESVFALTFGGSDTMSVGFQDVQVVAYDVSGIPEYDGDYTVVPAIEAQTLETKDTRMTDDVTVTAIPYYETANLSDGTTVIIGG